MIHEIGTELAAALKKAGCPFDVVDGPEPSDTTTWGRQRIVIEHDDDGSDSFIAPRTQGLNPELSQVRVQALKITIYAQSTLPGARVFEHRRRANNVLDQVIVGLRNIGQLRKNECLFKAGHFVTPKDLEGSVIPGGAAYELKFTFERGITKANFVGEIQPTAQPGAYGVQSTTKVSRANGLDDDGDDTTVPATAETACGA